MLPRIKAHASRGEAAPDDGQDPVDCRQGLLLSDKAVGVGEVHGQITPNVKAAVSAMLHARSSN
jgi:hypothetical protein